MDEALEHGAPSLSLDQEEAHEGVGEFGPELLRDVADLVLKTTFEGVWLIDATATTSFVNRRMAQMLGYSVGEMLGMPLFHFMDAQGAAITRANLERRRRGVQEQHEFECIRKDGTRIWLLVTANPVYDRAGCYAGALALIADLSVQKERERALAAEKGELERRILDLEAFRGPLSALTYRDPAAGIYNITYLDECLTREIERAARHSRELSVLLVTIDEFRTLLESQGRVGTAGVLQRVALVLTGGIGAKGNGVVRPYDIVARCGAEEFGILAPDTGVDGARGLGDAVLAALDAAFAVDRAEGLSLTVSVGVATFPLHAGSSVDLILAADRALYAAKLAGGGCVRVVEGLVPAKEP